MLKFSAPTCTISLHVDKFRARADSSHFSVGKQTLLAMKETRSLLLSSIQLTYHPAKDSGRGLSLLRAPSIPPENGATDIPHYRELMGKGHFTINIGF